MLNVSHGYVVRLQSDRADRSTDQGPHALTPFVAGGRPLFLLGEFVPAGEGKDPEHRVEGDGVGTVVGDEHAKRHFDSWFEVRCLIRFPEKVIQFFGCTLNHTHIHLLDGSGGDPNTTLNLKLKLP